GGEEAEDQEGDQAEDQKVHDLQLFETVAHEHRGQQAAGGQTGQRAEPARGTAGGSGRLLTTGSRCALLSRRGGLAGLVAGSGAEGFATAKTLGVGFEAEGQRQAQNHGDTEETLHYGFLSCGKAWSASCPPWLAMTSDRMFPAFARARLSASRTAPFPTAHASRSPGPGTPASRPRCDH